MHVETVSVDTSWLHNVWEMFLLFIKFKFPWKNGVSEKIKAHLAQHPTALQKLFSPHFLILFKTHPHLKRGQRVCILYDKVITILHDRFFIYRTVKS